MGEGSPILAAVGQLQFDVVQSRLQNEYNAESSLEPLPYSVARWVTNGWEAVEAAEPLYNVFIAKDRWERPVLLFNNDWGLKNLVEKHPELELAPWAFAPEDDSKK